MQDTNKQLVAGVAGAGAGFLLIWWLLHGRRATNVSSLQFKGTYTLGNSVAYGVRDSLGTEVLPTQTDGWTDGEVIGAKVDLPSGDYVVDMRFGAVG